MSSNPTRFTFLYGPGSGPMQQHTSPLHSGGLFDCFLALLLYSPWFARGCVFVFFGSPGPAQETRRELVCLLCGAYGGFGLRRMVVFACWGFQCPFLPQESAG